MAVSKKGKVVHVEDPAQQRRRPTAPWKHIVRSRRREAAVGRQAARDSRSDEEQLARLDDMFGPGQGAQRERARLAARMEKAA